MENFNTIPNRGRFYNVVSAINANFELAYEILIRLSKTLADSRGMFSTVELLNATWPSPQVGWWAYVGTSFPVNVYVCNTAGTWTDSGDTWSGENVDLASYATKDYVDGKYVLLEREEDYEDLVASGAVKNDVLYLVAEE